MRINTSTSDDRRALAPDRYFHPDPRVQRKMEVLWLKSHGLNHDDIAAYADVSRSTVSASGDNGSPPPRSGILGGAGAASTRRP